MTIERAKELLPVIQAYAEGREIQFHDGNRWRYFEKGHVPIFADDSKYRIKPSPTLRPWKSEEVPVGALLKTKSSSVYLVYLIVSCGELKGGKPVTVVADGAIERHSLQYLLDDFEHSLDHGLSWKPCGVEE